MSAEDTHGSAEVAARVERRWATIAVIIVVGMALLAAFAGIHRATMPQPRVETTDPSRIHLSGEFVESNLGTSVAADGRVTVRIVAQQYSFEPQCIVVPAEMPVTFRATSTDVIHGFVVGTTNANTMLVPGFVATFTTTFARAGEHLMPCHEYCGTGHEAMWARVQVIPAREFLSRATRGERLSCVSR